MNLNNNNHGNNVTNINRSTNKATQAANIPILNDEQLVQGKQVFSSNASSRRIAIENNIKMLRHMESRKYVILE